MTQPETTEKTQTLLEHLDDLRIRIIWALVGLAIGTVIGVVFTRPLLSLLTRPFCEYLVLPGTTEPAGAQCAVRLITLRPTEALETYFKIALTAGAILAMPFILYQLWLFITPGLAKQERRYVYVFLPSATLLFVTGVAFAWFVLLPPAFYFLVNFLSDSINNQWQLAPYISFTTSFMFWIGVSFEMPLIIYILARVGVVSANVLREQWRVALVGIAVLAAVITPSVDPITMLLTMVPLVILYILSIFLARLGQRQFERSMLTGVRSKFLRREDEEGVQ